MKYPAGINVEIYLNKIKLYIMVTADIPLAHLQTSENFYLWGSYSYSWSDKNGVGERCSCQRVNRTPFTAKPRLTCSAFWPNN